MSFTEEGEVTIVDMPLVLNDDHTPNHTHQPPCPPSLLGLRPFEEDHTSPDYSLSIEPDPLTEDNLPHKTLSYEENVLIDGSLIEIGRGQSSPWIPEHPSHPSNKETPDSQTSHSLPLQQQIEEEGMVLPPSHAHSKQRQTKEGVVADGEGMPWYDVDGAVKLSPKGRGVSHAQHRDRDRGVSHAHYRSRDGGSEEQLSSPASGDKDGLVKGGGLISSLEEITKIKHSVSLD